MEDFEREIKVLVVGNSGVGKTSMVRRFCSNVFTEDYKKTIGADFLEKALFVPALGEDVRLFCWDTLNKDYYRGAGAAVIVFSTTDRASFDAVASWRRQVVAECGDVAMALVQSKVDLLDRAVVSSEEVEEMARRMGVKLFRQCVKEGLNVTEVFTFLAELHDRKTAAGQITSGAATQALVPEPSAAGAASRQQGASASGGANADPQQGSGDVIAEIVTTVEWAEGSTAKKGASLVSSAAGSTSGRSAGGSGTAGAEAELQPSKRRGKKTVGQRVSKAFRGLLGR